MYHLLNDSHLITPKDHLDAECEVCQNQFDIRELSEVKIRDGKYKLMCDDCKNNHELYEGIEDEM